MTARRKSIEVTLEDIRFKIEKSVSDRTLNIKNAYSFIKEWPIWLPPGSIEKETRDFYQGLEIPLLNKQPSLLLHELNAEPSRYSRELFDGAQHQ